MTSKVIPKKRSPEREPSFSDKSPKRHTDDLPKSPTRSAIEPTQTTTVSSTTKPSDSNTFSVPSSKIASSITGSTPSKVKSTLASAPAVPDSPFVGSASAATASAASSTPKKTFGSAFAGPTFGSLLSKTASTTTSIFAQPSSSSTSVFGSKSSTSSSIFGKSNQDVEAEGEDNSGSSAPSSPSAEETAAAEFGTTKPLYPELEPQTVITGEENETTVASGRCKLYFLDDNKVWKERGIGTVKVNVENDDSTSRAKKVRARIVMRSDAVHHLLLNAPLFYGMSLNIDKNKFTVPCIDEDRKIIFYALKVNF
ncbi:hypothetical protein BKA69DRAFT_1076121, partial [Paraphysoderma sedebokerense]